MKLLSKTALGLALALGTVSMVAAVPAQAQKSKKGEAKGPSLKLSKEFRAAMAPVDKAYKAGDFPGVLTAAQGAESAATTPDEKYALNQYRLDAATKAQNADAQASALDAMLATGLVPAAEQPKFYFFAGKFAVDKGNYAKAEADLDRAVAGGYVNTDVLLTQSRVYSQQNKFQQALAALEKAIAAEQAEGRKPPEDWYKVGFSQAYKGKLDAEFAKWSMMHLKAYPSPENWRTTLVTYRDTQNLGNRVELDLFRLMRATKSLAGERDHYDYAYVANQAGLPGEAKSAIDLLKAGGGKTSQPINEIYTEVSAKVKGDQAGLAAEEAKAASAPNGVLAAGTANAYIGYGEYAKAAALLKTALGKGGVDANEVNTRLGIALALSGQKEEAKQAFAAVTGPRAGVAGLWLAYLDQSA